MLTRRHVLPPSLLGRMARHRLVQNARSRPNSKTASLYPECNQICAVHARSAYSTDSTPIFMSIGGLQAHVNSKPSMSATPGFINNPNLRQFGLLSRASQLVALPM